MDVFDRLQNRQISELRVSLRRLRSQGVHTDDLCRHVDKLDDYLGRTLLLLQAVTEACLRKELFTADELSELLTEIDASDGAVDGRLDLGTLLAEVDSPQTA